MEGEGDDVDDPEDTECLDNDYEMQRSDEIDKWMKQEAVGRRGSHDTV